MEYIKSFEQFIAERWQPRDIGTTDKEDLKDEEFIASFIEYNGLSELVLDIWRWAKSNFKIYPSKLTVQGMVYSLPKNCTLEIQFEGGDKMMMYKFDDSLISNNPMGVQKFNYRTFKEWLK